MAGERVGEIELQDQVFGIVPNVAVMHQALVRQLANARLGTAKAKGRSEVSGGGRKPWRQKGTGRARQGSTRAPQWKGGGVVFGPQPRSYVQKMNRKMRRLALRSALSTKVGGEQVIVMDELALETVKTKEMAAWLERMEIGTTALVLMPGADESVERAARNLPYVKVGRADCLSVRDLLKYDFVVMPRGSVDLIHDMLGAPEGE
jgi:large subunit ribosomal protein L4